MANINKDGYLDRRVRSGYKSNPNSKAVRRDWWLVKHKGCGGYIIIGKSGEIYLNKKYLGKRIRLKVEIIE